MLNSLLKFLTTSEVVFSVVVMIIGLIIYFTRTLTTLSFKAKAGEKVDSKLEKGLERLTWEVIRVVKDVAHIKGLLTNKTSFTKSNSPISLSEKGEDIAEKLEVDKILNKCWGDISSKISAKLEALKDKTPYVIQTICFAIAEGYLEFVDDNEKTKIEAVAFNEGVDLTTFSEVFGIRFRDKYLKEKGIDLSEIDKQKPN